MSTSLQMSFAVFMRKKNSISLIDADVEPSPVKKMQDHIKCGKMEVFEHVIVKVALSWITFLRTF